MDFVNELLGSTSCNVDGSMDMNPLMSFADQMLTADTYQYSASTAPSSESILYEMTDNLVEKNQVFLQEQPASQMNGFHHFSNSNIPANYFNYAYAAQMPFYSAPLMQYSMGFPLSQSQHQHEDETEATIYDEFHNFTQTTEPDILDDGPSKAGYTEAWEAVKEKLEHGDDQGNEYRFIAENSQYDPAQQIEEEDISDLFQRGMELYHSGDVNGAIESFEACVQHERSLYNSTSEARTDSWRMLGVCHADNDEDKKAIVCLNHAIDCDPYNLDALLTLGTSYVNELDSVKALETLRAWITHNPRFQGLKVTADEYSDGTLMDEVLQLVLEAQVWAPEDKNILTLLGVLYNVSLDYDGAVRSFHRALVDDPNDFPLLNKIGATLANSNNSGDAIPYYEKALSVRPTYARAWLNMGISYANLNQYEDAAKAYIRALKLNPKARHIWGYLRIVLSSMDRFDLVELAGRESMDPLITEFGLQV